MANATIDFEFGMGEIVIIRANQIHGEVMGLNVGEGGVKMYHVSYKRDDGGISEQWFIGSKLQNTTEED